MSLTDLRINRTKKHNLIDILVSEVCAVLSGADTWIDIVNWCEENIEWLKENLDLPNHIPCHDTNARVFFNYRHRRVCESIFFMDKPEGERD